MSTAWRPFPVTPSEVEAIQDSAEAIAESKFAKDVHHKIIHTIVVRAWRDALRWRDENPEIPSGVYQPGGEIEIK
jgi:hypothetical protein